MFWEATQGYNKNVVVIKARNMRKVILWEICCGAVPPNGKCSKCIYLDPNFQKNNGNFRVLPLLGTAHQTQTQCHSQTSLLYLKLKYPMFDPIDGLWVVIFDAILVTQLLKIPMFNWIWNFFKSLVNF